MAAAHAPPPQPTPPRPNPTPPWMPDPPYPYHGYAPTAWWTQEGLKGLTIATKCAAAASVLFVVLGLVVYDALQAGTGSALDSASPAGTISDLVASVLTLAALAYGLGAVGKVRRGKGELGPEHEASVKRAMMCLAIAVVLGFVSAAAQIVIGLRAAFEGGFQAGQGGTMPTMPPAGSDFYQGLELSLFPASIAVVFLALFMDGMLVSLLSARGRKLRLPFYALSFSSAAVQFALGLWLMRVLPPLNLNVLQASTALGLAGLASALTVPAMVLYLKMVEDANATIPSKVAKLGHHPLAWPSQVGGAAASPPTPSPGVR